MISEYLNAVIWSIDSRNFDTGGFGFGWRPEYFSTKLANTFLCKLTLSFTSTNHWQLIDQNKSIDHTTGRGERGFVAVLFCESAYRSKVVLWPTNQEL
jgi:hypothetical protein